MVRSQVRSLVIPLFLSAGILTAGVSVLAFQGAGGREARPNRPLQRVVPPDVAKAATTPPGPSAGGEAELARKIVSELEKLTAAGELNDPESFHTWSLRLLEAEKRESPDNTPPIAAFEGHLQRMKRMLQGVERLSAAGQGSAGSVARWQFFLKESERLLNGARQAQPGGGSGMMAGMMGAGGGMMAGRGGMMGSYAPMMAGEGLPAAGAAPAGPQPPAPRPDLGGGFGGGGGDEGPSEDDSRIKIARICALLSTIDKNPKTLAVNKKLEEPATLHFPNEAPLEEILKRVKDASKGSDGRKIPIYVDPLGLQEADKVLSAPVTIDLEDTPLKFSLRLVLKQLGLAYCVRDGVLIISSVQGIERELAEALAELRALNPDMFPPGMMGGGGMGGMGGGMGGMGKPGGMM